jgi:molybdate transport system permease protein
MRRGLRPLAVLSSVLPVYILFTLLALPFATTPSDLWEHVRSETALRALFLSLRTTLLATVLCILFGTPLAYVLARQRFRGRDALDTLLELPVTIPPVVAGVALLLAFGRRGYLGRFLDVFGIQIPFSTVAVVMAQVFMASPFFVTAARSGFETVDRTLERVAGTLGASPWRVFWTITLPLAAPSLIAGATLAWARSLSEFGATMMFAGNFPGRTQTLPLAVMSAMESDLDTAIAISMVTILLAGAALLAARRFALAHRIRV